MTVGVLGGGQLGRMLALAGVPLGETFSFFAPPTDTRGRAEPIGDLVEAAFEDLSALEAFAARVDVVTYEFENVPVASVRHLETRVVVAPGSEALAASQDRLTEKTFFRRLGIPTAPFFDVPSRSALDEAFDALGPGILKTRRLGYDGKGQVIARSRDALGEAWAAIGAEGCIFEGMVSFSRELSILAARGVNGEMVFWPLFENTHEGGILRLSVCPAPNVTEAKEREARELARSIAESLGYVGVFAVELFDTGLRLVANEMAPRVHNSGHLTIEGAETSQFENHLRAILGLPLGVTRMRGHAAMVNLIGRLPDRSMLAAVPNAHIHLYGKAPQPGRKLGHVTLRFDERQDVERELARVVHLVSRS